MLVEAERRRVYDDARRKATSQTAEAA
jgi:hypothetical protein